MITALSLDAGNTLFTERTSRAEVYTRIAADHGLPLEETAVAEAMDQIHQALPQTIDGAFRYSVPWFRHFIREVFAKLGVRSVPRPIETKLFEAFETASTFRLFDDVLPTLRTLHTAGVPMIVVSNWAPSLPKLLKRLQLDSFFDHCLVSATAEAEKPEPEIFRLACRRLNLPADQLLHVGDHPVNDVEGARAIGCQALLLDRRNARDHSDRLTSLAQLIERFRHTG